MYLLHVFLPVSKVNTNGVISFGASEANYSSDPFPIDGSKLIAPFWADVDTSSGSGQVWYRSTNDSALLEQVMMEIQEDFEEHQSFVPTTLFIVTWDEVGHFGGDAGLVR